MNFWAKLKVYGWDPSTTTLLRWYCTHTHVIAFLIFLANRSTSQTLYRFYACDCAGCYRWVCLFLMTFFSCVIWKKIPITLLLQRKKTKKIAPCCYTPTCSAYAVLQLWNKKFLCSMLGLLQIPNFPVLQVSCCFFFCFLFFDFFFCWYFTTPSHDYKQHLIEKEGVFSIVTLEKTFCFQALTDSAKMGFIRHVQQKIKKVLGDKDLGNASSTHKVFFFFFFCLVNSFF